MRFNSVLPARNAMTRLKRKKDLPAETLGDLRFGTPVEVAEYRAERLRADTVIEAGAGAGFQTRSFASRAKRVIAIDPDAERLGRASFGENVTAIVGDALDPAVIARARGLVEGSALVFLDPERPPKAAERTLSEIKQDPLLFVERWSAVTEDIAIELAPFLKEIPFACEREYTSFEGELNRLTVYLGGLRRCDVSVVRLPQGERIAHSGPLPAFEDAAVDGAYILEPDRALEHAGLCPLALPPAVACMLGKRRAYLTDELPRNGFFKAYAVLERTDREGLPDALSSLGCGTPILHGSLAQGEQAALLKELKPACTGTRRLHVFFSDIILICEKITTN